MTNTGHKASSYLICTHVCRDIVHRVSYGRFLSANTESQRTLSARYLTALSQQMLTAVKHVADDNVVFSRTAYWHIMHATQSNYRRENSQFHFFKKMAFDLTAQQ